MLALFLLHFNRPLFFFSGLLAFAYFFFGLRFNYFTSVHSFVSKRAAAQDLNFFFFGLLAFGLRALVNILKGAERKPASYLILFGAIFAFFLNFLVGLVFVLDLKNMVSYLFVFFFKKIFLVFFGFFFWDFFFLKKRFVLHATLFLYFFFFKFGVFFDFSQAGAYLLEPSFVEVNSLLKRVSSYASNLAGDLGRFDGVWSYNTSNLRLKGSFTYSVINKNNLFFSGLLFFNLFLITRKLYYLPSFLAVSALFWALLL